MSEPTGKQKVKKFIKELFGKKYYTMDHSDLGEDTEFTVSKKRTKVKGKIGGKKKKEILKDVEKEWADRAMKESFGYKKGGALNFKKGGIIQHD